MKIAISMMFALLLTPGLLMADAGILLPRDKAQPDPAILSLEEMEINIRIDNGDARVFVRQIFANHTDTIEEGTYIFALPSQATVSDFAVWDGPTRIPAVVLERKRAEDIYSQLKRQAIDPGLLQMGERGAEEAKRSSIFSARIVPIQPYATKRLEIEYHQPIPVENLKSYFAVPLRPDAHSSQSARHLRITFDLQSAYSLSDFQANTKVFPLTITQNGPHSVTGQFSGDNVNLSEDFVVTYNLDASTADTLNLLTYRNPASGQPSATETAPERNSKQPGFFEAEALLGNAKSNPAPKEDPSHPGPPRTFVIIFDTSLSMQWEKLERSYQALEGLLRTLRPSDRFNLLLFNDQVTPYRPTAATAEPENVQSALNFVRASKLRGGTDLQRALQEGLKQCAESGAADPYLILLSDGGATRGPVQNGRLASWYEENWKKLPENQRPRTYIFGVGDDANLPLLRMLARHNGLLESVLSTEPAEFKLNSFLSKIGRSPIGQLDLSVSPGSAVDMVYPLQETVFGGSIASWIGRYQSENKNAAFTVQGVRDGAVVKMSANHDLPVEALEHTQLPRLWARSRVDALLEKIQRDGEDQATIDEIIRLARQYKFVTPYTSFLAVPRALLRPRVIRPGDPVLRVKTDESISSVTALFPFGLIQKLRYLSGEDVWQTRFLAPGDMQDGTYTVRLVLRDRQGRTYREFKTFVIASRPPVVQIKLDTKRYHRGQTVKVRASASQSTRTLSALLEGVQPVALRWDAQAGINSGQLLIPEHIVPGTYRLTVTAEDIAHNIGTQEVQIEVLP
jgi:Ca-activated chloride channel family protein